jgi:hypothetical protein
MHVPFASVTIISVLYKNTDEMQTNYQVAKAKPIDVTAIILSTLIALAKAAPV